MLSIKINPVGIDYHIQQLQTKLHTDLIDADHWALADAAQYEAYGRCHRNKTDDGYIAEVFHSGNEYKEIFWNDTLTALSFFGISNTIKRGVNNEADVHFVMFANLAKLALVDADGTVIAHRADEELRQMVTGITGKYSFGFKIQSVDLWLENVLREYSGSRRDDRLKYVDMHPVHCFRINLKLLYNPNKIC
jgi:hypothetical protein